MSHSRGVDNARIIQVIETEALRGDGTEADKYVMIVPDCEDDLWYQFVHHNSNNEKYK